MSQPKLKPKSNTLIANSLPLSAGEFAELMQQSGCTSGKPLAIAISGGADSMALLTLAVQWNEAPLTALTVDHALREASSHEAAQVAKWCQALGVKHHTLHWHHDAITTGIQNKARDARYQLMLDWCRAHNIHHLLTAHHVNDQVETLLFRLARGSGLDGMRGMQKCSWRQGVFLHRPLLSIQHNRLVATLQKTSHPWLNDPSNDDARYTRIHIRKQVSSVDNSVDDNFGKSAEFLSYFFKLLEYKLVDSLNYFFEFHQEGYGWLHHDPFQEQPFELKSRTLTFLLHTISGDATPIRAEALQRAISQFATLRPFSFHGCLFRYVSKQKRWLIYREPKAIKAAVEISDGPILWDNRYLVSTILKNHRLQALGRTISPEIADALKTSPIPKPVWPSLPALFHLEECIAVPHISYGQAVLNIRFCPAKLLAGEWFFGMNTIT